MDVIGLAILFIVVILGLKECRQQEIDFELDKKKIEFKIDSLERIK